MKDCLIKFNKFLAKRVILLFIIFLILNIVAILPSFNFVSDVLSHFVVQYLVCAFGFFAIFLYLIFYNKKFLIGTFIALLLGCINFGFIFSANNAAIDMENIQKNSSEAISLGVVNVLTSNTNYERFLKIISEENPDILILQEVDNTWLENIKELNNTYLYRFENPRDDNFGIAIYSKMPLINSELESWTDFDVPVIKTGIKISKQIYTIYGVHTLPPIGKSYITIRNEMLQKIGKIMQSDPNVIIAGDLNTTIYSNAYREFISSQGIKDAQATLKNSNGTWNTRHLPFFRISLEHVLYKNSNIKINFFKRGDFFGSDHFPIFVNISFYKSK